MHMIIIIYHDPCKLGRLLILLQMAVELLISALLHVWFVVWREWRHTWLDIFRSELVLLVIFFVLDHASAFI